MLTLSWEGGHLKVGGHMKKQIQNKLIRIQKKIIKGGFNDWAVHFTIY